MTLAKENFIQYSDRSTPDSLHEVNLTRLVNSTALGKVFVTKGFTLQGIVTPGRKKKLCSQNNKIRLTYHLQHTKSYLKVKTNLSNVTIA